MSSHAEYWKNWMGRGHVVAFGVVGDPAGVYGVGLVQFANEAEVREFTSNDPTILSNRGFRWEVLPMPFGVVYPQSPMSGVNQTGAPNRGTTPRAAW